MKTTHKTPLIIDCQVFQAAAWHRGMGKYSLALLQGMLRHQSLLKKHEIHYLFNSTIDKNQKAIDAIKAADPDAKFIFIDLEVPTESYAKQSVESVRRTNKAKLNTVLAGEFDIKTCSFLILSLYLDEVCPVFPDEVIEKALVYYDSIPYLYPERYGQFIGFFDNFYMPHTATVYEATKLLAISKTVANDLNIIFGLPKERIFSINGASIPRSATTAVEPKQFKLKKNSFVLMPTGQELRKNNLRAVRAFRQFLESTGKDVQLVTTSHFTDEMKEQLKGICDSIVFTGNVDEDEIAWLYSNCRFVLFPSEYEGLGLPILEAAEAGRPIACSDISVFREMSKTAFRYFDPLDVDSIADALVELYDDLPSDTELKTLYKEVLDVYTWDNTADHLFEALQSKGLSQATGVKKKVAIFCPDPTGFSAIGKVVTECHAWYSEYFDITYYFDKGENHQAIRPNPLPSLTTCYDVADFKPGDEAQYEALIYHVGNSEYHVNIIHIALAIPGFVILHDTYLNGAYANLRELNYISQQRLDLEDKLDMLVRDDGPSGAPRSRDLTSLVNNQRAVVCHSKYAQRAVSKKLIESDAKVRQVNLPVDTPLFPEIVKSSNKNINIAFAGIIARVKGTDILEDIARSEEFSDCRVTIFGYSAVEPERMEALRELPHVKLVNNPTDREFQTLMAGADVLLNVRQAYKGETSLTTLEAMRYGVAVIVRDFGWYGELPSAAVAKVDNPRQTIDALRKLVADRALLDGVKQTALKHIQSNFSHEQYAQAMYDLIDETK